MEIGVTRADPADAVLPHQSCRLGVMPQVPREARHLSDHIAKHVRMTFGLNQHAECGSSGDGGKELVRFTAGPRLAQDSWMCHNAQELVANSPREVPRAIPLPPALDEGPTPLVLRRAHIGGVHEHVGIDDEHLTPFHRAVERLAIGDVNQRTTAAEGWKWREWFSLASGLQQVSQCRLDEFGHRAPSARRLTAQPCHDGVIDIQCCFHMANHTVRMALCQSQPAWRLRPYDLPAHLLDRLPGRRSSVPPICCWDAPVTSAFCVLMLSIAGEWITGFSRHANAALIISAGRVGYTWE